MNAPTGHLFYNEQVSMNQIQQLPAQNINITKWFVQLKAKNAAS